MKSKIIKLFVIGLLFGMAPACNYLDVSDELAGGITDISQVFNNVDRTKKWYGQVFDNVPDYSRMWADAGMGNIWAAYADELYTRIANNTKKYTEWNAFNTASARYSALFQSIRQANIFLENARAIVEDGGPNAARLSEADVERYRANVRFMRAVYYFYLMELYGPVPLITRSLTLEDELDLPRASVDEMVNFIDSELLEAMAGMEQEPYHNNESYLAVPTKGVAMAYRAKLWAYAASPLFNGGFAEAVALRDRDGKQLFPPYSADKWQKAVDVNKEFIDYAEAGRYELHKNATLDPNLSVYEVFQQYNREIIWATSKTSWGAITDQNFDRMTTPRSEPEGGGSMHVLQELVDAFYMADGLPIKEMSFLPKSPAYDATEAGFGMLDGFEVSKMYIGREPRFYNTVTFSGKKWQVSGNEVQFYRGGKADNSVPDGAPVTGYLLYKRLNRTIHGSGATGSTKSKFRPSIIFRLADFYLLYAEVLNEVNPSHPDVLKYLNLVRARAGLSTKIEILNPSIVGNQDKLRDAIRHERRIELATEGQRYFDVRRWMIAEKAPGEGGQGGDFTGMNPDRGKKEGYHVRKKVHTRSFKRKNYLYPIVYDEIQRSRQMVQNPGWE
jgi:hypothetical protein